MAVILWAMALSLLLQGCFCSLAQTDRGCMKWKSHGDNVCCDACHPGNRLVRECGPNPEELCTPCEPGTYVNEPKSPRCYTCRQCVAAHVHVKECTSSSDTVCGCHEGLLCGGDRCAFCVKKCDKGQEPTDKRSCRPCPHGTFNNQTHQMCKPWSTKCPNPDHKIVASADAFSDIKCSNDSIVPPVRTQKPEEHTEQTWPLVLPVAIGTALLCMIVFITVTRKILQRKTKEEKEPETATEKMIIRPPSDDPRTLIAIECSFHEAQQEQGSSSESLASKDSSDQLLP